MNNFFYSEMLAEPYRNDLKTITTRLEKTMRCNCDLDKWEPEKSTGHSFVCRIHKTALREFEKEKR